MFQSVHILINDLKTLCYYTGTQYLLLKLFAIKSSTHKQLSAMVTMYIIARKKKREIKSISCTALVI